MCAILLNVLLIVLTMQILGYKHSVARDTSDSNYTMVSDSNYTMEGNVSDSTQTVEAASNVSINEHNERFCTQYKQKDVCQFISRKH